MLESHLLWLNNIKLCLSSFLLEWLSFVDLDRTRYESQRVLLLLSHLFDSYSPALAWETSKIDVCKRTLLFWADAPRHSPSFCTFGFQYAVLSFKQKETKHWPCNVSQEEASRAAVKVIKVKLLNETKKWLINYFVEETQNEKDVEDYANWITK